MVRFAYVFAWAILLPHVLRADQFDYYLNMVLAKAVENSSMKDAALKEVKELSSEELGDYAQALPDTNATMLVVYTQDRRYSKLLIHPARQKVGEDKQIGMFLVDKYITFKEATERGIKASGINLNLYSGSRLNLDLGQVVPEQLAADLIISEKEKGSSSLIIKPGEKVRLFVLTKPIAGVVPKKAPKLVVGEKFEPRFFNGTFKLYDDGRRSGQLKLEVNDMGEVSGSFYSDRDGQKYEVQGKIGTPQHSVSFTIKFPAVQQTFNGFLFTGNAKAIAGTTKLQEREAGFYAERTEE